jgi:hypothetical protein
MVETTKTAEALETAVGGQGVMQSEYFKLKYNPETGRWEKEKVTEDVTPVFPGIRDVTPEYTPEGKTFKTIPIGAGPDYTPLPPVVTPTPTPPVEPPVETPTEPVTPIVTEPETRGTDVAQEQIEREQVFKPKNTFVDTDGVTKKSIVAQPNYRVKYQSMPGGLNNMSDAQVLQYAIETGALNQMLSQENNPYFVTEPEKKEGIMAELGATTTLPIKAGAAMLDATLGKMSRKALVKRLVDANILFGDANNYIDDKGNFKSNDVGRLVKLFKDESTPMNGLTSAEQPVDIINRQREPFDVTGDPEGIRAQSVREYFGTSKGENQDDINFRIRMLQSEIDSIDNQNRIFDETGFYTGVTGINKEKKFGPGPDIANVRYLDLQEREKMLAEIKDLNNKLTTGSFEETIYDPRGRSDVNPDGPGFKTITPGLLEELEKLKTEQANRLEAAKSMGQVGIRGFGDTANVFVEPKVRFIDGLKQAKIKRTTVNGVNYQFVDAGISEAQPVMGLSGDPTNGEKVYLDSNAGFYNSQGQYVADDNGDGIADKPRGGSASEAAEAANAGYIPQKLLDRMTNPDGSLKNLYDPNAKDFVGGKYKLDSSVVEIRDGKAYYKGNVVKENRDVVDNGGNGNVVDNAAPDNSNDKKDYERDKEMEKAKEDPSDVNYTQANYEAASGTGSGSSDTSSKDKKDKIVCTEMYRQTQLDDWQRTIKLWYLFQKKYLSKTHQKGYHFLFKPFVKGMQKSNMLTSIGRHFAQERTKDIKHIMYGTKFSLLGRVYRIILEPICFIVGLLLWQKK